MFSITNEKQTIHLPSEYSFKNYILLKNLKPTFACFMIAQALLVGSDKIWTPSWKLWVYPRAAAKLDVLGKPPDARVLRLGCPNLLSQLLLMQMINGFTPSSSTCL